MISENQLASQSLEGIRMKYEEVKLAPHGMTENPNNFLAAILQSVVSSGASLQPEAAEIN